MEQNLTRSFLSQEPDTLVTINRGALIGLLVVAVAVAMVIIVSLLMVRRKPYGTISHGIVEVKWERTLCTIQLPPVSKAGCVFFPLPKSNTHPAWSIESYKQSLFLILT